MSVINHRLFSHWYTNDGRSHGEVKRTIKRRDTIDWKRHADLELREMEEDMNDYNYVYMVVNLFTPKDSDFEGREDISLHATENGAWDTLSEIARDLGIEIDGDDTSFEAPPSAALEEDYYYIEEMVVYG